MPSPLEVLQRRFGDARPGLQLIAVEAAAVPVTVVRADVLAQERQTLPLAEEFVLRFVAQGVRTPTEIAAYLGLETSHVLDAAAAQIAENHLARSQSAGVLGLTQVGTEIASTLAATQPVLRQLPVVFDRLSWTLAGYAERALVTKKEAQEAGMIVLPPSKNAHISLNDITARAFNLLLRGGRLQVLRVNKVAAATKHRYFPVQLLVYADLQSREIELAVCIDDDLATQHGFELARAGAVQRLGLTLGEPEARPILEEEIERQREEPTSEEARDADGSRTEAGALVRSVSVFEHAHLLDEALRSASDRLLIISPWIRNAVVGTDFLSKVEQRLRAGVKVTIAHGYGSDDSGSDEVALRRLRNLARRFESFTFLRVKNTHAKILIFDGSWVSTSFNWLSFRGDPDRTYRMEEGTLVRIPTRVDDEYVRYLQLIEDQKIE